MLALLCCRPSQPQLSLQLVAWTGSYLWLFAGMYAPLLIGLTVATLVRPSLFPDGRNYVGLYYVGQFVAILACVVALAPPEK